MGWYVSPRARSWQSLPLDESPREFHRTLPEYAPTPLTEVPALAAELDVGRVFVKDESSRLGLPAFKILGASFAIARALSARFGAPALSLDELRGRLAGGGPVLAAATDGNHGRAVARVAAWLGVRAVISVPPGVSAAARDAIAAEGATLIELDLPYDDVVRHVAHTLDERTLLVQDTAWPGYTQVPQWIVDGYDTMLAEVDEQLAADGVPRPDLVVAPAGVGSLAQAVVAHYRRCIPCSPASAVSAVTAATAVLVAEPDTAASVTTALVAGRIVSVRTAETVMTGLNCGTVSEIAWPTLQQGLDASATVTDSEARLAVGDLAGHGLDVGPCGAAPLAAARRVLTVPGRRDALRVRADAVVVLLSTEGRAANPKVLA